MALGDAMKTAMTLVEDPGSAEVESQRVKSREAWRLRDTCPWVEAQGKF